VVFGYVKYNTIVIASVCTSENALAPKSSILGKREKLGKNKDNTQCTGGQNRDKEVVQKNGGANFTS